VAPVYSRQAAHDRVQHLFMWSELLQNAVARLDAERISHKAMALSKLCSEVLSPQSLRVFRREPASR
jgi:hypothetical protein